MSDLTEFLLARIAEDETAAQAVPSLEQNFDVGGNRQDERFTFGRTFPSSADGNWSPHRSSSTTRAHFERHTPARVLTECEAKRRIVGAALRDQRIAARDIGRHVLRLLAVPYANHPDYRPEWRL